MFPTECRSKTRFSYTVSPLSPQSLINVAFLLRLVTRSSIHSLPVHSKPEGFAFQSIFDRYVACPVSHLAILLPTSVRSRYFADPLSMNRSLFPVCNHPVPAPFVPYSVCFPTKLKEFLIEIRGTLDANSFFCNLKCFN